MRSSLGIGVCVCSLALLLMGQEGGCGGTADGGGSGNTPGAGGDNGVAGAGGSRSPSESKNHCDRLLDNAKAATLCNRWCETERCGTGQANEVFDGCVHACEVELATCCGKQRAEEWTCSLDSGCEDPCLDLPDPWIQCVDQSELCYQCLEDTTDCESDGGGSVPTGPGCNSHYQGCYSSHDCNVTTREESGCLSEEFAGHCTFDDCMEDRYENCYP